MCEKYERVPRSSLVEVKGIVVMLKVLPDVLLQEVYGEVFLACVEEPVAISQSHAQVFMHVGVSIWPARPMSMAFLPFANPITNGSQCSLNFCLSGCGATD
jgi:hypothetical protein